MSAVGKEKSEQLTAALIAVTAAPTLWRFNGCGCTIVGRFRDPDIAPFYFGLYMLTLVWVPIVPLGIYLVSNAGERSYRFHAKIRAVEFGRLYPNGWYVLAGTCLLESALWVVGILLLIGFIAMVFPHGNYYLRLRL